MFGTANDIIAVEYDSNGRYCDNTLLREYYKCVAKRTKN